MSEYYEKYIKYKNKYINLQSQLGGTPPPPPDDVMIPRRERNLIVSPSHDVMIPRRDDSKT
jgi:hypothetical protein